MRRTRSDEQIVPASAQLPSRIYSTVRQVDGLPLAVLDATVVGMAYATGLFLGYEGALLGAARTSFWVMVLVPVVVHQLVNRRLGLYGPVWRYASVEEAARIVGAVLLASGISAMALVVIEKLIDVPVPLLTAPSVAALLVLVGSGGLRFQSRLFALERRPHGSAQRSRTVIVGAGDTGASVALEASRDPRAGLEIVGFVDDDRAKRGRSIRSLRVLGTVEQLSEICREHAVDTVLVAIPTATRGDVRRILTHARATDAQVKMLPAPLEMVRGPLLKTVRDIEVTDLLGREQIEIEAEDVMQYVTGAVVLVTGAGGSIGSEIVRQIAMYGPERLLLLDHDETSLHDLRMIDSVEGEAVLADIRDTVRVNQVFARYRPDVVFHAAAHKHVPMLEAHPIEAILTNVVGTHNLVCAAAAHGCQRFVLISTDKAVNPCSVMGATKRLAELLVHCVGRAAGRPYAAVRFGNVLNSRGSVVPTFLSQILRGGPVTLTSGEMTRYFMSIPEAVALVLQAAALTSDEGDILMLEMGEPVRILDLANQMIRLAGLRPEVDVPIVVTGLRPGERLHEQLSDDAEDVGPTSHPSIRRLTPRVRLEHDELEDLLRVLHDFCDRAADGAAVALLEQLLRQAGVACRLEHPVADGTISLDTPLREYVNVP